ncbi:MAG: tRNA (adenosine(37)-N6)-dimethylallyltransferase MiaA [Nocardioides sp.]|nr:tRNA (adenosine(37)-N6)-dimethylallyltransferase MiaA [Nocardioides sp.]
MSAAAASPSRPAKVVAVVGATASGKTHLSLDLAEALGGEIINTDAMQVYRGMDVGTAKVDMSERRGIAHHLLDVMEVTEAGSVADFQRIARATIEGLRSRETTPVLVGGSALYTRAVLDRFEFPGTDPEVRRRLTSELDVVGPSTLHHRLAELDPPAAEGILPSNGRRIVRALEVIEVSGRPFSSTLPRWEYAVPGVVQIGVDIDREALHERIAERVDLMFESGFVEEVRSLLGSGLRDSPTASRAIGYREVMELVDGRITEAEARERTTVATRRFARKQDSWFRKDPRVTWLHWSDPELVAKAVRVVEHGKFDQPAGERDRTD